MDPLSQIELPDIAFEKMLLFLPYCELAKLRRVNKRFNTTCKSLLNKGFRIALRNTSHSLNQAELKLPRRRSERRSHPLRKDYLILQSVNAEVTYMKSKFESFIQADLCCFIPGKVVDEIFLILRTLSDQDEARRPLGILKELRDLSSMAIDHLNVILAPSFKRELSPTSRPSQFQKKQLNNIPTDMKDMAKKIELLEGKVKSQNEVIAQQQAALGDLHQIKKQLNNVTTDMKEMSKKMEVLEEKVKSQAEVIAQQQSAPVKTRYNGDVVMGRVVEVQQQRWKVDINSRLDAVLMLSSVNLHGGELKRRSAEDELMMRRYLEEGNMISAKVQNIFNDGSLKYGKLGHGCLVNVSPSLIKRRKTHFHQFPFGTSIILGNNGFVWISQTLSAEDETSGGFGQNREVVPSGEREAMARLRNVVLALARNGTMLWDTSLIYGYEASGKYSITELLSPVFMKDVAILTQQRLQLET